MVRGQRNVVLRYAAACWVALCVASCTLPAGGQVPDPAPRPAPTPPAPPQPKPVPPAPAPAPAPDPPFVPKQDAKAVITTLGGQSVPGRWPLGVPMLLSAKASIAGTRENSVGWEIDPPWVDQNSARTENNRILSVGTGTRPKRIVVTLTVAKDDTFSKARVTVDAVPDPDEPGVDPAPPAPTPGPAPPGPAPPAPAPGPSPPLNARAQKVADMAAQNVGAYAGRADMARALGTLYAQAATNISRAVALNPPPADLQPYVTPDGIVKATGKSIQTTLGADVDRWRGFFGALRDYLNDMGAQGQLNAAGDYIPVFRDIAAGLGSVR